MRVFTLSLLHLLISFLLSGQTNVNRTIQPGNEGSDKKFGKLIMEMPFGATLYRADNKPAGEIKEDIITSCTGKAILIDFWATWCGPCLNAMPHQKRIYFETKDLPLEFIYMCTSFATDIDTWITKISELKQPGIHLFVEDSLETQIMELFSAGGFPSYVFINTDGEYKPGAVPLNSSTTSNNIRHLLTK